MSTSATWALSTRDKKPKEEKLQNPEKPRFAAFSFVHQGMTDDRGAKKGKTATFNNSTKKNGKYETFLKFCYFPCLIFRGIYVE